MRSWDVQKKNGMIWAWDHSEEAPPAWDFPELEEIGHENNKDPVHFQFVHGIAEEPESEIHFPEDGRHYQIVSHSDRETEWGTFKTSLVRDSWGLGLDAIWTKGIPEAGSLLFAATTPIDENRVHSRWLLTATRNCVDRVGGGY